MNQFERFMEQIHHRGPDHTGIHKISNQCLLGTNRLSIIDSNDTANQPFHLDSYSISFNGAIYNYLELKQDLEAKGIIFKTESDTEVLLQLYIHYGKNCLDQLDGMFSFVIYNTQDSSLFGARDPFGIKPFYYYKNRDQLIIGSEVKQFKNIPSLNLNVNTDQIQYFLHSNGYKNRDHQTFFEEIHQLEPGHFIEWDPHTNSLICESYYDIASSVKTNGTLKSVQELLEKAVQKRTIGDFTVSSFLSGGLDSSIISQFLYKNQKNQLHTYSYIETIDSSLSERKYIDAFLSNYPHQNHHVTSDELIDNLQSCLYHQDEPISSWSIVAQYVLYQKVHLHQERVIISGQGADETFGGYPGFLRFLPITQWLNHPFEFALNMFSYGKTYFNNTSPNLIQIESPDVKTSLSLESYTLNMIKHKGLRDLLHYEDRNSMAFSVETRLPFLDKKLVEEAIGLPATLKFLGARRKGLLLELFKKELPKKILNRRKKFGFETSDDKMIHDKNFNFQESFDFIKDAFPNLHWNPEVKYIEKLSPKSKWLLYFLEQWLQMTV